MILSSLVLTFNKFFEQWFSGNRGDMCSTRTAFDRSRRVTSVTITTGSDILAVSFPFSMGKKLPFSMMKWSKTLSVNEMI